MSLSVSAGQRVQFLRSIPLETTEQGCVKTNYKENNVLISLHPKSIPSRGARKEHSEKWTDPSHTFLLLKTLLNRLATW